MTGTSTGRRKAPAQHLPLGSGCPPLLRECPARLAEGSRCPEHLQGTHRSLHPTGGMSPAPTHDETTQDARTTAPPHVACSGFPCVPCHCYQGPLDEAGMGWRKNKAENLTAASKWDCKCLITSALLPQLSNPCASPLPSFPALGRSTPSVPALPVTHH